MAVAVAPRGRARRTRRRLRLDRQHRRLGRRVRGTGRVCRAVIVAARRAQSPAGSSRRCSPPGAELREIGGHLRGRAPALARHARRGGGLVNVNSINPDRHRGPGLGRARDRRAARRAARRARAPVRRRREHDAHTCAGSKRRARRSRGFSPSQSASVPTTVGSAIRIVEPDPPRRRSEAVGRGGHGQRRRAARVVVGDRAARRALLRAGLRRGSRRASRRCGRAAGSSACSPATGSRIPTRSSGCDEVRAPRNDREPRPRVRLRCGRARPLERGRGARGRGRSRPTRLTSASARSGWSPRPRDCRSSGPTGSRARAARLERGDDRARAGRGDEVVGAGASSSEELLARGWPARGSLRQPGRLPGRRGLPDLGRADRAARRLAAARRRSPSSRRRRCSTAESRLALPAEVSHADAAFNVARAALLGAGLARGDAGSLAAAFADRLHEPYRPSRDPRRDHAPSCPPAPSGATLSGSGPDRDRLGRRRREPAPPSSTARFPDETVLRRCRSSTEGAH